MKTCRISKWDGTFTHYLSVRGNARGGRTSISLYRKLPSGKLDGSVCTFMTTEIASLKIFRDALDARIKELESR